MICICCDSFFEESPIEHIVPESLGNVKYVLQSNVVCKTCNSNFSNWEREALTNSHLGFIRIKNSIKTKKGKPSSLRIGNLSASGNQKFERDFIEFRGIEQQNMTGNKPIDGAIEIKFNDFDKSEMSTSKMLLKIGFEAIYKSQTKLFSRLDFTELKKHLTKKANADWPFLTSHNQYYDYKSIPTFNDKYQLNRIKCKLSYSEISKNALLFDMKYDYWHLTINLLNRDYSWVQVYFINDSSSSLYPKYLKRG